MVVHQFPNHVCVLTEGEIVETVTRIIQPYIDNRINTIIVGDSFLCQAIRDRFDFESHQSLRLVPTAEAYAKENRFDFEQSITNLTKILEELGGEPFLLVGQLQSLQGYHEDMEHILDYETEANQLLSPMYATAFCLYDTGDLSLGEVQSLIDSHPFCMISNRILRNESFLKAQYRSLTTICMICKRIKSESGKWIYPKGSAIPLNVPSFSHGLCNSCVKNY